MMPFKIIAVKNIIYVNMIMFEKLKAGFISIFYLY